MNIEWLNYTSIPIGLIVWGVPMVWAMIRFSHRPVQDVIGLNETRISTAAAMLLSWIIIVMTVGIAVRLTVAAISEQRFWLMPLTIPPILVLLAAVATGLATDSRFGATIKSSAAKTSLQNVIKLRRLINLLARKLRLNHTPALRIGPDDISPFCYGRSSRRATVVLPGNLEDICLRASQNDHHAADLLMRFVISHELSHIRNGDCAAMSWLTLFYKDMKLALIAIGLCTVAYVLFGLWGDILRQITAPFLLTLLSMPFLKWTIARIAKYREFTADARSSRLFNSNEMEQLTQRVNPGVASPLEFLVTFFFLRAAAFFGAGRFLKKGTSRFCYGALGWAEPSLSIAKTRLAHRLWSAVVRLHPAVDVRQKALRNRSYTGKSLPYPSWPSALQIHIIGVLCFLCLFVYLRSIILPVISNYIQLAKAEAITFGSLFGATTVVLICFPALAFSMPARVSSQQLKGNFRYMLFLVKRYIGGAGVGILVFLPTFALLFTIFSIGHFAEIPREYLLCVLLCPFCELIGVPFAVLLASNPPDEFSRLMRIERTSALRVSLPSILAIISMTVPIVTVFSPISLPVGLIGGCVVMGYMIARLEGGSLLHQLLVWRIGRVRICLDGLTYRRWAHFALIAIIAVPFAAATWLTALLVQPVIALFAKTDTVWWMAILLLLAVVFFFCGVALLYVKMSQRAIKKYLSLMLVNVYRYLTILKLTGPPMPSQTLSELSNLMRGSQNSSGAFSEKYGSPLTFMEPTYHAVCCLDHLDSGVIDQDKLADWINSCRCSGGGFALYPGGRPRLAATYWALNILKCLGQLPATKDTDTAWILGKQTSEGYFLDPNSSYGPAQQTWYAIESLGLLRAPEAINRVVIGHFTKTVLKGDALSIFEAVYAVEILGKLNLLEDTVLSDVFHRFVVPISQRIHELPIHQNLVLLEAYARLLSKTKPVDPESSEVVLNVLSERVSRAFQDYLQSLRKAPPRQKQGSCH